MKKKLILLLLLGTFFFTGCTVDYQLVINSKKQVKEIGTFAELNSELQKFNLTGKQFLKNKEESYQGVEGFDKYKTKNKVTTDQSSMTLTRKYQTMEQYIQSPIFHTLYEKGAITKNNQDYTFTTTGDFYYSNLYSTEEFDMEMPMGEVNIKIRFHNKVVSSNADVVDEKSNTYTWVVNKDTKEKAITFSLNNEKRYDVIVIDFFRDNLLYILGISVIMIVALFLYIHFHSTNKRNNDI